MSSDDEVPYALTTHQFLESVRSRLRPDGVVVSNLWTRNPLYDDMVATYRAVFSDVAILAVPARTQHILVAADGRDMQRAALTSAVAEFEERAAPGLHLSALVRTGYMEGGPTRGTVLRDR